MGSVCHGTWTWVTPGVSLGCGHIFLNALIFGSNDLGIGTFFMNYKMKLHLHRVSGRYDVSVQRPSPLSDVQPNRISKSNEPLDLFAGSTCAYGGRREICNQGQDPFWNATACSACSPRSPQEINTVDGVATKTRLSG